MTSDEGPLYAECPTTEVTVDVDAPRDRVWSLVTDLDLPARFSSEFQGADWVDPGAGLALGAQFVGRSRHEALGQWETTSTVVELEPPARFAYAVTEVEAPSATWRYELADTPTGGTRLTQWVQMGPGRSGLSLAIDAMPDKERRIVRRRLRDLQTNMRATCEGIKALAEGSSVDAQGVPR
ncbi:MAG TPA: SRPBCC family protein [Mycobacteriales bacterium]|jgi:uncharacterized protein YndB with AHSA1/START domain|nr:SRPBCC family protein [Mycobacteriales bacterium]